MHNLFWSHKYLWLSWFGFVSFIKHSFFDWSGNAIHHLKMSPFSCISNYSVNRLNKSHVEPSNMTQIKFDQNEKEHHYIFESNACEIFLK